MSILPSIHISSFMKNYSELFKLSQDPEKNTVFSSISSLFVAIATTIFDVGTKWNDVHNVHIAIYPCFKFHEKIWRTFKVIAGSRKVWQTDSQTDSQTDAQSANHKSPPVKPVKDKNRRMIFTLNFHHSKCAAPWDKHTCQISSCYLQYYKSHGQC